MGFHKCDKANRCPYKSDTDPGYCGYSTCRLECEIEREFNGYYRVLVMDKSLSYAEAYSRAKENVERRNGIKR